MSLNLFLSGQTLRQQIIIYTETIVTRAFRYLTLYYICTHVIGVCKQSLCFL